MTRERPKCQVCGNGIHVAMFGRQWVHWSHLLDLDHKAAPEPSQREAQDKKSGSWTGGSSDGENAEADRSSASEGAGSNPVRQQPAPGFLPLTARQFDTIEAGYERIWWRYA